MDSKRIKLSDSHNQDLLELEEKLVSNANIPNSLLINKTTEKKHGSFKTEFTPSDGIILLFFTFNSIFNPFLVLKRAKDFMQEAKQKKDVQIEDKSNDDDQPHVEMNLLLFEQEQNDDSDEDSNADSNDGINALLESGSSSHSSDYLSDSNDNSSDDSSEESNEEDSEATSQSHDLNSSELDNSNSKLLNGIEKTEDNLH